MTVNEVAILVGALIVFLILVAGVAELVADRVARTALERRSELERVEAEANRLRYRLDAALRRTSLGVELADRVSRAGATVSALDLLLLYLGAAIAGAAVVTTLAPSFLGPLGAWIGYVGVQSWLERKRRARLEEFVAQLPELARTLSNATSAGRSLLSALQVAADDLADPAGTELGLVSEQLRIGASVDSALETLRERLPSRELAVLVSTLVIQQRTGGDVVRALRDMAETLEDRKDLRREVKTIVAGAVSTGYVTGGMGLALVLLVDRSQGGMIDQMARQPLGIVALVIAGALYAVAFLAARRMTDIDV